MKRSTCFEQRAAALRAKKAAQKCGFTWPADAAKLGLDPGEEHVHRCSNYEGHGRTHQCNCGTLRTEKVTKTNGG